MKAADLIPEIRKAYAALMKAETEGFGQSLFLAIELGTLLNQAKADPEVGAHGKWEKWFDAQASPISQGPLHRLWMLLVLVARCRLVGFQLGKLIRSTKRLCRIFGMRASSSLAW